MRPLHGGAEAIIDHFQCREISAEDVESLQAQREDAPVIERKPLQSKRMRTEEIQEDEVGFD